MKLFIPGAGMKVSHILNFKEIPDVTKVIISDIYPWTYGTFVADASYILPRFDAPEFFKEFYAVYEKERFDVCIPMHDSCLYLFNKNRESLLKQPFKLAMNPKETVDLVSDKLMTYRFFVENDIPTAELYTIDDFMGLGTYSFPYYIKPRYIYLRGTERQVYMKIEDSYDMEYALRRIKGNEEEFVVQEFLSGTEINVDFFCDDSGRVKSIVPLKRLGMGISRGITQGEIIFDDSFDPYVLKITELVRFWGANQVQLYVSDDNTFKFVELNGRFSGSSIMVKEAGVNYFYYFVKLLRGEEIEIREKPRYLQMSCWEKPFFFDRSRIRAASDV